MARFYQERDGSFCPVETLWKALSLDEVSHRVISLVGAGGKTSTMYQLAKECRDRGRSVIITTSTHIACPKEYPVAVIQRASQLDELFDEGMLPKILVVAGERIDERGKLAGMPVSEICKLKNYCDVLLIEADGSRRLPLKVCAEHEPVICDVTQVVIGCVGLSAAGQQWQDGCFRWELVEKQGMIQPEQIAGIVMDDKIGTRKRVGDRAYRIVLNQMDDEGLRQTAEMIAGHLKRRRGSMPVLAASSYIE